MSEPSKFTDRDHVLIIAAVQCIQDGLPTTAGLDLPKFATMTGLAENSARTAWSNLRKKILTTQDEDDAEPKTPTGEKAKKPATKRKATGGKKGGDGEDVDGNAEPNTPSKKPRGRPPKSAAKITGSDDEDTEIKDATEVPATTPAKKKAAAKKATPKKAAAKQTKTSKSEDAEAGDDAEAEGDAEADVKAEDGPPAKKAKATLKKAKATPKTTDTDASASASAEADEDAEAEPAVKKEKAKPVPKKAKTSKTPETPVAGSDDTAHEDETTITVDSSKAVVEVQVAGGETEIIVKDEAALKSEEVTATS